MPRIYIQKRPGFDHHSLSLQALIDSQTKLNVQVSVLLGYDIFNLDEALLPQALSSVFSEVMSDEIVATLPNTSNTFIAREPLPGQYDQRADSAAQCLRLLDASTQSTVKTFELAIFNRNLLEEEKNIFKRLWINPIELREKDLNEEQHLNEERQDEGELIDFIKWDHPTIQTYLHDSGAAMNLEDFLIIQTHFSTHENRNPSHTEFKILDTYWSDHCRHTTFETELSEINIPEGPYAHVLQSILDDVQAKRYTLNRTHKPLTLMELATLFGRFRNDERVEHSEEVNACSVKIDVETQLGKEEWLLQFKNETHNHPTEIEPFGGASTCIGGAIRDPLSGRAYVYQAMRISGCGDVRQSSDETLVGKLPQRIIAKRATHGNSAYGNQIGVATTYTKEIYHPKYVAKHLELGAVVGAVKAQQVTRLSPEVGDVILLMGGKTGRDGIGGATGSSKSHTSLSLDRSASEVQKGNAPEERKLQRLFRNPEVSIRIKKANDFGAGGVCVAIGELAPGLLIDLDAIPTKYEGLSATDLAISESQERMAIVIDPKDLEFMMYCAHQENVEATLVAKVTSSNRLQMTYQSSLVCDLDRRLIDTNGFRQSVKASLTQKAFQPTPNKPLTQKRILDHLASLNVTLQKGMIEHFDASIGASTVLFPLGGKHQISPTQGSVQRISTLNKRSKTVSILTHGFIPKLSETSTLISAQGAVLESIAKTIALGGKIDNIFFSLQEYFPKLGQDAHKWGQVTQALLAAYQVQAIFNRPAIGGKDSMSGSFKELDVLETLVSFACSVAAETDIRIQSLSEANMNLYVVTAPKNEQGLFDVKACYERYREVENLQRTNSLKAVRVIEESLLATLVAMVYSDDVHFELNTNLDVLAPYEASFLIATKLKEVPESWTLIGKSVLHQSRINGLNLDDVAAKEAYTTGLDFLYPREKMISNQACKLKERHLPSKVYPHTAVDEVKVIIPYFPGTNCEEDSALAFLEAGAHPKLVAIRNLTPLDLQTSIQSFVSELNSAHILMLPGGFSSGDEPDGSAKFIVNVLRNPHVKDAVHRLLKRDGLILGICNGFQALIKTGLLPYGEIRDLNSTDATLTHNTIGRHISSIVNTKLVSNASPWLTDLDFNQVYKVPISHGEGRLKVSSSMVKAWEEAGQIAFQYCDDLGESSMSSTSNPNGSDYAIEALISRSGQILGKMGHTERVVSGLYKNIKNIQTCPIIQNGVDYFKKGAAHGKD